MVRPKRRWLRWLAMGLLAALLIVVAGFISLVYWFYHHGLSKLPELPAADTRPVPAMLKAAIWAEYRGSGPIVIENFGPLELILRSIDHDVLHKRETSPLNNRLFDGWDLVHQCSNLRITSFGNQQCLTRTTWVTRDALTSWISRNWSPEQIFSCIAYYWFRNDSGGIDQAALPYYELLTPAEAALQVALYERRQWNNPENIQAHRDFLLDRMEINGAITRTEKTEAQRQPVVLTPVTFFL
jgi:hypothetical protein